ncbi:hypothetical protein QBC36DRAFT_370729 [Triangularia setosa]|uniref:Uncharacterized protein n=1 Tax=Triangularia setosa TaxID=2587417 RepID=A0AAN6VWW4_9PEZI|nr:hypothetical protein QBC36DRAFT_370729 [Podospora setosa]
MLHSPHPSNAKPFLSFLPSPIIFFINAVILSRFWHIHIPTMSPSPSPSPFELYSPLSLTETHRFISAVQYLNAYCWHDAFEAICTTWNAMHAAPAKHPGLHLLPDINELFKAIMHHHAYGVDHQVDRAINHLLHLAVRTCQESRINQCRTHYDEGIRWMSPSEVEMGQHLQFYRTFCRYLENYSMCVKSDHILDDIRNLLQKLYPTVNNLSGWVSLTPPRDIRQDMQGAAANNMLTKLPSRRSQRLRSHHSTPEPASFNSRWQRRASRPRRAKVTPLGPRQLPTPLTQTGDLGWFLTYKTEDYIPSLPTPITPFSVPPCSSQLPNVAECQEEPEEEPTQLLGSRALQFVKPPIQRPRSVVQRRGVPDSLPADFTSLRPVHVHVPSQRCCSGL